MAWYRLEEMLWQEVQEIVPARCDLAFLPVGTIEAHGSAAIGTDNMIPMDIAEYLAERFEAILLPCVHYGITRSLYGYAGSLTIRPEIFRDYIFDILASLKDKKFDRIIIINGHGGNDGALKEAAYRVFMQHGLKVAVLHWWVLCADVTEQVYGGPGGHAGRDETGYVMSINPDYGKRERYDPKLAFHFQEGADIYPIPGSVLLYDNSGQGEPDFDAAKGKELAVKIKQRMGDYLDDLFDRWKTFFPRT